MLIYARIDFFLLPSNDGGFSDKIWSSRVGRNETNGANRVAVFDGLFKLE